MLQELKRLILEPSPLRAVIKRIIGRFEIGSYRSRLLLGVLSHPHYGHCVYHAAALAKNLGINRISVLEFGVAGGIGLLSFEYHAAEVKKIFGVDIDVYGFDTGEGLPEPKDFRDLPYHWKAGFYKMDVPKLKARLKSSTLVLGDIEETSKDFFEKYDPAPIGVISYDFDFYSSTETALKMLEADEKYFLPRVFCYFDDVIGTETIMYDDFTGERLAINEFNNSHDKIKLGVQYHLITRKIVEGWYHQMWTCHFFDHSRYNDFVSEDNQQHPLI